MFFVSVMILMVGVVAAVVGVLYVSYVSLVWFLNRPFSYQAVAQWISFVICMALLTGSISYFIPSHWQDLMSGALAHFGCMLSFHILILAIEGFLRESKQYEVSKSLIYTLIVIVYLVLATNCAVLIVLNGSWQAFAHMAQMAVEYFTRTALLLALLIEIYARRLQQKEEFIEYNYTNDEYQDYDNQW